MAPERSNDITGNQLRNVPQITSSLSSTSAPYPIINNPSGNPPPIPPRQPVHNYSSYNDYRMYGSNCYSGYGYGLGSQYRGPSTYGGYNSYGYSPYSSYNNYGSFGNPSGDVENRPGQRWLEKHMVLLLPFACSARQSPLRPLRLSFQHEPHDAAPAGYSPLLRKHVHAHKTLLVQHRGARAEGRVRVDVVGTALSSRRRGKAAPCVFRAVVAQYFEESTRPTFQLIETVLQTFSSMTMLLESTYFTLTNSFRAIISVAENVGKLRSTIGQLFHTFALIRFLKWLYKKIIRNTGFQGESSLNNELWEKSVAKTGNENVNNNNSPLWSGFFLFSVFFVIPYMIHKITNSIRNVQIKGKDPKDWYQYDQPVFVASVLYDFTASNNEELSVKVGQKVYLAPQDLQPKNLPGWCRATDSANVGLIPYNYVKVIGQLKKRKENEVISLNEEKSSSNESRCSTTENSEILKTNENLTNDVKKQST